MIYLLGGCQLTVEPVPRFGFIRHGRQGLLVSLLVPVADCSLIGRIMAGCHHIAAATGTRPNNRVRLLIEKWETLSETEYAWQFAVPPRHAQVPAIDALPAVQKHPGATS